MNGRRRVVITGMGVVSPLGNDLASFRQRLFAGHCAIGPQRRLPPEWPEQDGQPCEILVAQAPAPELGELPPSLNPALLDDFAVFALAAAAEAVRDSGPDNLAALRRRAAVVLGAAVGGDGARNTGTYRAYMLGRKPHPNTVVRAMANCAASAVSVAHGITGPCFSVNSACASASHAIAQATWMIRGGAVDIALAGGSESLPSFSLYRAWQSMRVLSHSGCRPFAADRDGLVLGEGAGVVVLEDYQAARARGATIYAEIVGCGLNADAVDMVQPDAERMQEAMLAALAEGDYRPAEVDHINAHGTGTRLNDLAEAQAIAALLGAAVARVPVAACKSLFGHCIGAAGALELIATALSLHHRCVPPTFRGPRDPDCPLMLVADQPLQRELKLALTHSFGFGGLNAVLALAHHPP